MSSRPKGRDSEAALVEVVVVTWNSARVLRGLLDSLAAGMRGLAWGLIVVDNASQDATIETAQSHPAVAESGRIVRMDRNAGFAAAVNRGLAEADPASDVLILNPDVRLAPDCAARMRARLRVATAASLCRTGLSHGRARTVGARVGIVAPRVHDGAGRLAPTLRYAPSVTRALAEASIGVRVSGRLGWGEPVLSPDAYSRPSVADWASGAALMISRECLAACGPLDDSYFLYSEDTEYALRARDRGFVTQLAPEALATHLGGSSRSDPELWTRLVCNKLALYRRRHGAVRGLAFHLASLLRELRLAARGSEPSRRAARALLAAFTAGRGSSNVLATVDAGRDTGVARRG
jgi:N-acetylglucosaminyl-diphospho-decaprenol L-rhamnosyltransferase